MKKVIIALIPLLMLTACATKPKGLAAYVDRSAEQIYNEGFNLAKSRKYKAATERFEALDAMYPFSNYTQQAQLQAIHAYYSDVDYPSALAAAERYIHLYPRSDNVDYAYYMKGLSHQSLNKSWIYKISTIDPAKRDLAPMREAFTTYHDLVTYFPKSQYTPDARRRMIFIRSILADHELDVAKFYFKRKAYLASANRASFIVENYDGCAEVKEALEMMIQSYCALGKPDLAADARRVYQRTFGKA